VDHSAGHITTSESHELIDALQEAVAQSSLRLYPGVSYRHLLVWAGGRSNLETTPPHDIPGKPVIPYQEVYHQEPVLLSFIEKAATILANHPVNQTRQASGQRPANAVWLWGQGKAPSMPDLKEKFGLTGAMISAVDLLKGLGVYAGLEAIPVPGATGYLDTNYAGKVEAALKALETGDLVYVHIEAPDETGHEGSIPKKIEAIEAFDENVVKPMVEGAQKFPEVRTLIVTDHYTPISVRTHVTDPVPFLMVDNLHGPEKETYSPETTFCERTAQGANWVMKDGVSLFEHFVGVR
jgi:2,3-bisphosphoglycerate-independent phosphoglycerate mutase